MLRLFASERFVEVPLDAPLQKRYAVSNYGRLISFTDAMENGQIINPPPESPFAFTVVARDAAQSPKHTISAVAAMRKASHTRELCTT